ncbi:peroxidase 24-like [Aristolochia californica]|uniref:peroxidase 24-like n=1 Tax=Aristolochia californica TaxID=171875 RepID=UPI0035E1BA95
MKGICLLFLVTVSVFGLIGECSGDALKKNFYKKSCRNAEKIVKNVTERLTAAEPDVAADLLRLHYHDCFVRGCDASILLDKAGADPSEKEARPNLSLQGFDAIDTIKSEVEAACPGIVSCADILALAARDAVSFQFNKSMWDVFTGRKDGRVSLSSEVTGNLPSPFSNFTTLQQLFALKGLTVKDLVALSGAHTIGVSHCGAFGRRLANFSVNNDIDPSLDAAYAQTLRSQCSNPPDPATTVEMDPQSSLNFDTNYFLILTQKKGLFQSDAALLTNSASAKLVKQFQRQKDFFTQFANSMKKMGAIQVLTGSPGEIRKQCHVVN